MKLWGYVDKQSRKEPSPPHNQDF